MDASARAVPVGKHVARELRHRVTVVNSRVSHRPVAHFPLESHRRHRRYNVAGVRCDPVLENAAGRASGYSSTPDSKRGHTISRLSNCRIHAPPEAVMQGVLLHSTQLAQCVIDFVSSFLEFGASPNCIRRRGCYCFLGGSSVFRQSKEFPRRCHADPEPVHGWVPDFSGQLAFRTSIPRLLQDGVEQLWCEFCKVA